MTPTVRAAAAEFLSVALLLVMVVMIYVAVFGISGAGVEQTPSTVAILIATVVVALMVRPVYHRLRRDLRRRLRVNTLSPVEVLGHLSAGVSGSAAGRDGVTSEGGLPRHLLTVVHRALQTSRSELWIVVDGRPKAAAWLPESANPPPPLDTEDPVVHPILLGAAAVGYLRLEPAAGREFSTTESRLLAACANQAGLVLAMIARQQGLRRREAELTDRAADLRRSRAHLIDAARSERRRLERDLHDGAQQQLIALGLSVQLARQLAGRAPDRARDVLEQAAEQARRAGLELGRLTESLYPAVLREDSLVVALRHATDRAGVRVTVAVEPPDADRSLDDDSRDAVFFVVLEAVQNAVKHGGAERISIAMERRRGVLIVEIIDRGKGFDPARTRPGEGMRNMRRRLVEIDGDLAVASEPGGGTTVTVSVPFRETAPRTHR